MGVQDKDDFWLFHVKDRDIVFEDEDTLLLFNHSTRTLIPISSNVILGNEEALALTRVYSLGHVSSTEWHAFHVLAIQLTGWKQWDNWVVKESLRVGHR